MIVAERTALVAECLARIGPIPTSGGDPRGRAIPLSDEEWAARAEKLREILASFETMPDDPPGTDEMVMRHIDEERRRTGMRTLFEGSY